MIKLIFVALCLFSRCALALRCNGHESLCARKYNNITYLATHNSYAYTKNVGSTQQYPITSQLDQGVRALKLTTAQPGRWSNTSEHKVQLCHTMCEILDAGPLEDTLDIIANWLKQNPHEVLTIMMNNIGDFHSRNIEPVFKASKIMPYLYIKQRYTHNWPTLQEMIESNKRLVVFLDIGADPSEVSWINHQFEYMWETPYNNFGPSEFNCEIDRPEDPKEPNEMMYLMNHFLYGVFSVGDNIKVPMPQPGKAEDTNSNLLSQHVSNCTHITDRPPNYIEVDFYDMGNAMEQINKLNNVPEVQRARPRGSAGRMVRISTISTSNADSSQPCIFRIASLASALTILMFSL
ncbi:hypothetical protein VKS41_003052 [Umbelopsis sp. WA50703]